MANKNDYTSSERLYLDKDGKVVKADDPARASLLVAEGGTLPYDVAAQHGLVGEEATAAGEEVKANEEVTEGDDLESLTVAELKEKAKEMGLTGYSSLNKEDLIAAIEAGPQEEEEEE